MEAVALLNSQLQHPERSRAEVEAEATPQAQHSHKPGLTTRFPIFRDLIHVQEQGLKLERGVGSHPEAGQ